MTLQDRGPNYSWQVFQIIGAKIYFEADGACINAVGGIQTVEVQ